jgi:hypothetical protein
VSTARMALPDGVADPLPELFEALRVGLPPGKQSSMDILRAHQPGTADNYAIAIFIPHQSGTRTNAKSPANLCRNRDLAL